MTDTIIIGAGLSGLTTGYLLATNGFKDFLILDGRHRIGGRIFTKDHIDLGATWFQDHHTALSTWLEQLGIPKFRQYQQGKSVFVYSSMAPPQYFDTGNPENSAYRIAGGSQKLINNLARSIEDKIWLDYLVEKIEFNKNGVAITTSKKTFQAKKVVLALPPKLASVINFIPELPVLLRKALNETHTWMSNAIKVGISYDKAFWKVQGLSGTIIGHVSPMIEIYDHSDYEESSFHLMGFANEGLRSLSEEERKQKILDHLAKHLGKEVYNYTSYLEKDWSTDHMTSRNHLSSVYISPNYGNPVFQKSFFSDRLFFSGAETATTHGGYMDGAILSGERIFKLLNEIR